MEKRKRTNLLVTCTPLGILVNYQSKEEIERLHRRREFFKFGQTAELYLFSLKLKKEISQFRAERKSTCKIL